MYLTVFQDTPYQGNETELYSDVKMKAENWSCYRAKTYSQWARTTFLKYKAFFGLRDCIGAGRLSLRPVLKCKEGRER